MNSLNISFLSWSFPASITQISLFAKAQLQIHFFCFTQILGKKAEKLKRAILIISYLLLLETVRHESEGRAISVKPRAAVAADVSVGIWVPDAVVDFQFLLGECVIQSHRLRLDARKRNRAIIVQLSYGHKLTVKLGFKEITKKIEEIQISGNGSGATARCGQVHHYVMIIKCWWQSHATPPILE